MKPKSINEWSKAELMSLPHRKWDDTKKKYDSLLIFSTGKKHDSGWARMAIIGCRKNDPEEICSVCSDDIQWRIHDNGTYLMGEFRSDMALRSGALHLWSREGKFRVGTALSSTEIEFVR